MESMAEMLVLAKSSHTYNGVTRKFILEVDTAEIEKTPKFDPAKDELPLSMQKAIKLATSSYKENYGKEPRGIASVSLNHFPGWDYNDRWHFTIDIVGNPNIQVIVLFNEKVVLPREI
jgi:hypothetical protein